MQKELLALMAVVARILSETCYGANCKLGDVNTDQFAAKMSKIYPGLTTLEE